MTLKRIMLAVAFIGSYNSVQTVDTSTTFEQGLKYVEYHLVAKSTHQMNTEDAHFGAIGALATAIYAGSLIKTTDLHEVNQKDIIKVGFAAGILTTLYYKMIACFRARAIYTNNFLNFVKTWDHHKAYTAKQFHALFDALSELLETKGEDAVRAHTGEVIGLIKFHLSHEFSSRYPNNSGKMVDTLKAVTDIAKNINDLNNQ